MDVRGGARATRGGAHARAVARRLRRAEARHERGHRLRGRDHGSIRGRGGRRGGARARRRGRGRGLVRREPSADAHLGRTLPRGRLRLLGGGALLLPLSAAGCRPGRAEARGGLAPSLGDVLGRERLAHEPRFSPRGRVPLGRRPEARARRAPAGGRAGRRLPERDALAGSDPRRASTAWRAAPPRANSARYPGTRAASSIPRAACACRTPRPAPSGRARGTTSPRSWTRGNDCAHRVRETVRRRRGERARDWFPSR